MTLDSDRIYIIRLNTLTSGLNSISADVEACRFWCPDFVDYDVDLETEDVIGNDGATVISTGYRKPLEIQLIGRHNTTVGTAADAYPHGHLQNIHKMFDYIYLNRDADMYIDFEARSGTASAGTTRRMFVHPRRMKYIPVDGARYTDGEIRLDFVAADPYWYEPAIVSSSANSTSSTGQVVATVNQNHPSQRLTIKVVNTNGSAISGVTASSYSSGETWVISGVTVSTSGGYFEIDHGAGTVETIVSTTTTDIIGNFTGSFFPAAATVDIVKVLTAGDGTFRLESHVWERADWDIS